MGSLTKVSTVSLCKWKTSNKERTPCHMECMFFVNYESVDTERDHILTLVHN